MEVASRTMAMDFTVIWRPFFLDAQLPGGDGVDKMQHYNRKFGAERVAQMMPAMAKTFADEGISGYSINGRVGNTMDSHRLLEHALNQGGPAQQDALVEALFHRYFLGGRALSSREVLLEAAAEVKLDGAETVLDSEGLKEDVWLAVESAYSDGVSGVPYFRIDGGGHGKTVSGGQPAEVFLQIFRSLEPPPVGRVRSLHTFTVGSQVAVKGLVAKPEHNGKVGTVLGAQGAERVQVRLADGAELALKPTNLEPRGAGPTAEQQQQEGGVDLL